MTLTTAQKTLRKHANKTKAQTSRGFFKHCKDDIFLGVTAAQIKKTAQEFLDLPFSDIQKLMKSNVHEERSLAHKILCLKFHKSDEVMQEKIYQFYLKNRKTIRDWDGVDDSAPYIVGRHLLERDKTILYELVESDHLWSRRIAIVATWWFIRNNKINDTLKLSKKLLHDKEDLIHKAVGWMLREVGKKDLNALKKFIKTHYQHLPRTTLRYSIERFDPTERKKYLTLL